VSKNLKILLLEDVIDEAGLIERAIKKENIKFTILRVDTRQQFVDALNAFTPDLILSDHALPQFNSIEALKLARAHIHDVPFILVTGTVSEEFAVTCLKQGADDYVLKSNLSRLPSSIKQSLEQRKAVLQKQVAEHELKVHNELLSEANAELSKINKELDNFVYSVSHNLRGPLTTILGVINLAKIEKAEAQIAGNGEYLSMIEECVFKLDGTLRDILAYSGNARSEVVAEKIDLRNLFFKTFYKQAGAAMNDYEVSYNQIGDGLVISDAYRLHIIISNLISNAIKYSDPLKQTKVIRLDVSANDSQVTLTLADNGVGIESHILPRIFDMFYRGHAKSDGSGLGLYIVKEAVDKLGGSIQVISEAGVGTTFTVSIPMTS
jgi:signal transduction histidine kinase